MARRSLFRQFEQVRGTYTFKEDMYMDYAEQCGRNYASSVTGNVTVSGNQLTDSNVTFTKKQVNDFVVVDSGNNAGVYQITSWSGTHDVLVSGTFSETTTSLNYRLHYYQNTEDDLNYLRTQMHNVIGGTSWYGDTCTNLCDMAFLIPKRPNYVGETAQYPTKRLGTVGFAISDINQQGYVSSGAPASEYTDNTTTAATSEYIRYTDDNTMTISIAPTNGFYPADTGYIRIYQDNVVIGELDLAAAWTSDNCSYEESESDVGNNPIHTPGGGGTDIIALSDRRCMNNSVDGYDDFWPAYQIACMSASITLALGVVGQIDVRHSVDGDDDYTYAKFWVDTTSQSISATAPTMSVGTVISRHLSGVAYADTGSTFGISINNTDTLFDRGYVSTPCRIYLSEFNASDQTPSYVNLGLSTPLAITDAINTYNTAVATVGGGNFRDMDARASVRYYNVFTNSQSSSSAAGTYRIDTYGNTSNDVNEYFDDEQYRFIGNSTNENTTFNSITIDETNSNWVEATSVITQVDHASYIGLVCYNGGLKYASINHSSGFVPVGPDYSGASGNSRYYRVYLSTGAFTQGRLRFVGWSNALSTVQGATIGVHLRMPNCTDYSNGNTASWQDLSVDEGNYGGNGCLGTGSSGEYVNYSFGTQSSSPYGNRIIIRITATGSFTNLQGLYFEPTL